MKTKLDNQRILWLNKIDLWLKKAIDFVIFRTNLRNINLSALKKVLCPNHQKDKTQSMQWTKMFCGKCKDLWTMVPCFLYHWCVVKNERIKTLIIFLQKRQKCNNANSGKMAQSTITRQDLLLQEKIFPKNKRKFTNTNTRTCMCSNMIWFLHKLHHFVFVGQAKFFVSL